MSCFYGGAYDGCGEYDCYDCGGQQLPEKLKAIEEWWNNMPPTVLNFIQDEEYQKYHEVYASHSKIVKDIQDLKNENYKLQKESEELEKKLKKLKSHHKMREQIKKELGIK